MQKKKMSKYFLLILLILFIFIIGINPVFAATSSELNFCSYSGVRKASKIVGIFLTIAKIVVPLIIIITGMISFTNVIISGKTEDLQNTAKQLIKKIIAGLIIFFIPGILDYCFENIVGYSDSDYTACVKCVTSPDSCNINVEDPKTTE